MHKTLIFILYKDNIIFYITINNFIQYQMVVDIFILWDKTHLIKQDIDIINVK